MVSIDIATVESPDILFLLHASKPIDLLLVLTRAILDRVTFEHKGVNMRIVQRLKSISH